mmetsp:Transcript_35830/g.83623  ORF Transcript_35830/g.83623 Transcript_35830/m.83623 type:complete len:210 (+) Transcript_35830:386-1015(+)
MGAGSVLRPSVDVAAPSHGTARRLPLVGGARDLPRVRVAVGADGAKPVVVRLARRGRVRDHPVALEAALELLRGLAADDEDRRSNEVVHGRVGDLGHVDARESARCLLERRMLRVVVAVAADDEHFVAGLVEAEGAQLLLQQRRLGRFEPHRIEDHQRAAEVLIGEGDAHAERDDAPVERVRPVARLARESAAAPPPLRRADRALPGAA